MIETLPAAPVSPEVRTPPKPSEYLRLASLTVPQGFGHMVNIEEYGAEGIRVTDACAMGTIMLGAGLVFTRDDGTVTATPSDEWERVHALLSHRDAAPCPSHDERGVWSVRSRVEHMNDTHRMSRAKIADWLESIGL